MPIAVPRSIANGRQPRDLVRWESDALKSILRKNSYPSIASRQFVNVAQNCTHDILTYFYNSNVIVDKVGEER